MTNYWDNSNITTGEVSLFGTLYQSSPSTIFTPNIDVSDPIVAGQYIQNSPMQYSAVDLLRMLGDRIQILPSELRDELLDAVSTSMPVEEGWVQQALIYVPDLFG